MRNEGKILSFDLLDKDGGEIKVTAWNEQVDTVVDLVEVRGRIVCANVRVVRQPLWHLSHCMLAGVQRCEVENCAVQGWKRGLLALACLAGLEGSSTAWGHKMDKVLNLPGWALSTL